MDKSMKCKYKYIQFIRSSKQNPKTWIYLVRANYDLALLGEIRWYAQWRQYAFYPESGTVFEKQCLADIKEFCIELNERQQLKRKKVIYIQTG